MTGPERKTLGLNQGKFGNSIQSQSRLFVEICSGNLYDATIGDAMIHHILSSDLSDTLIAHQRRAWLGCVYDRIGQKASLAVTKN